MRKLHGNPWAILVVVSLGFFMTLLDLTIVNIAIPNMITSCTRPSTTCCGCSTPTPSCSPSWSSRPGGWAT